MASPDGTVPRSPHGRDAGALTERVLSSETHEALMTAIFGGSPEEEDVVRWFNQPLGLSDVRGVRWGLRQRSGGPCGVLAPIQGFVLAHFLFGEDGSSRVGPMDAIPEPVDGEMKECVVRALSEILWRASGGELPVSVVTLREGVRKDDVGVGSAASVYVVREYGTEESLRSALGFALEDFGSNCGMMLVTWSLLLTRSLERISEDVDEPGAPLVGRFGHCGQELLNLALTGEATSNCHDGSKPIGDDPALAGLVVKGVSRRPRVGYLTRLEAMRYTTVGGYYKEPSLPIWVVGSESHFSVLFATDTAANEADPATAVRRAFDEKDPTGGGFVPRTELGQVLEKLKLPIVEKPIQMANFVGSFDPSMDVVTWGAFWEKVRPMLGSDPSFALVDEDQLQAEAKQVFDSCDGFGGGFLQRSQVNDVLARILGSDVDKEVLETVTKAVNKQVQDDILFWEPFWEAAGPAFIELHRSQAQADLDRQNVSTKRPESVASAAASAAAEEDDDASKGMTEYERMMQAQMAMGLGDGGDGKIEEAFEDVSNQAIAAASFESAAGGGGSSSGGVTRADSMQEDIKALYGDPKVIRTLRLLHYNGLEDRGRSPQCVQVTIRQTDSGVVLPKEIATATTEHQSSAAAAQEGEPDPKDAAAFEDVIRTKWPGASVSYDDNLAPKIN